MTRRLWRFGATFALAWTIAVPAPAQTTDTALRVNAGGDDYVDMRGALWQADHGYNTGEIGRVDTAIAGTEDDTLYQSQRWDDKEAPELAYAFALPDGDYVVHLHFVEFWDGAFAVGKRLFDVWLEGQRVLKRFDVYAEAGANNALVKSFPVTVSDGQLDLLFTHIKQNPMISAIEIVPQIPPVSDDPAVLRVNSGGGDYVDVAGHYWQADTDYDTGEISVVGAAIAGTEDDALYQTARWDPDSAPELAYSFALQDGDYLVKLHFAETWDGAFVVGKRLFDVWIEGQRVLKRFDVYGEAGSNQALIKHIPVSVSDGRLDLQFTRIKQNPMISAIEVLPLSASLPPVLAPIGNRLALIGDSVSFTISASHPDGSVPTLSVQGLPAG
ncbi:MAG: malectin, partial [Gammaproteobacteria bacterium]|nr:malectin [Gammaproteobacteria bacterium]